MNTLNQNNKSLSQFEEIIHTKKLTTILTLWGSNVRSKMKKTLGVFTKSHHCKNNCDQIPKQCFGRLMKRSVFVKGD